MNLPRLKTAMSSSSRNPSKYDRDRILALLSRPGCLFCREEEKTLKWFFFWYLHEGYPEPENIDRMRRSCGFCPRHTSRLLSESLPHVIAIIYLSLISSAIEKLREAEKAPSSGQLTEMLVPKQRCPSCETRDRNVGHNLRSLRATLGHPDVREALGRNAAICVPHLLMIASHLDWEELRYLVGEANHHLGRAGDESVPGDANSLAAMIWGFDQDAAYRENIPVTDGNDRDVELDMLGSAWSPTVTELRRRFSESGCFICHVQRRALAGYFEWLAKEIMEAPIYRWNAAFWLCREHAHEFALQKNELAVSKLERAIRAHWLANFEKLMEDLRYKPHDRLVFRLAEGPRRLREKLSEDARVPRTLQSELWTVLGEAVRPPGRILPELRERSLRATRCPACVYLETITIKNGDLLARAIEDPGTLRAYQESSGLCLRHLPRALTFREESESASNLLRAQKVRLELLQWELREYGRKQSWTLRYEPRGTEQDAPRRAVAQYTGV